MGTGGKGAANNGKISTTGTGKLPPAGKIRVADSVVRTELLSILSSGTIEASSVSLSL